MRREASIAEAEITKTDSEMASSGRRTEGSNMTGEADSSGRRENQPIREIEQPVQAGEEAERRVVNESEEARR